MVDGHVDKFESYIYIVFFYYSVYNYKLAVMSTHYLLDVG